VAKPARAASTTAIIEALGLGDPSLLPTVTWAEHDAFPPMGPFMRRLEHRPTRAGAKNQPGRKRPPRASSEGVACRSRRLDPGPATTIRSAVAHRRQTMARMTMVVRSALQHVEARAAHRLFVHRHRDARSPRRAPGWARPSGKARRRGWRTRLALAARTGWCRARPPAKSRPFRQSGDQFAERGVLDGGLQLGLGSLGPGRSGCWRARAVV